MHVLSQYKSTIEALLNELETTQSDAMETAAQLITEALIKKQAIFAFGASHAGILSMELFYRAGGMVPVNPIFDPGLLLDVRPVLKTTDNERLPGYGNIIFKHSAAKAGDVVIVHSVSGRNPVNIDFALSAQAAGLKVIVITNLNYTNAVSSRHSSGKKLKDCADVVIDNVGVIEDASQSIPGLAQKMGPTSTIIGAFIVNTLMMRVAELMLKAGVDVPVFHSANLDGGDAHNQKVLKDYKDQIFYQ